MYQCDSSLGEFLWKFQFTFRWDDLLRSRNCSQTNGCCNLSSGLYSQRWRYCCWWFLGDSWSKAQLTYYKTMVSGNSNVWWNVQQSGYAQMGQKCDRVHHASGIEDDAISSVWSHETQSVMQYALDCVQILHSNVPFAFGV